MPAITSPINDALPLRGVTKAARPSLHGKVILDGQAGLVVPTEVPTPVELAVRVVRSNGTGLLDFYYALSMPLFDYDDSIRMSVSFSIPGFKINFADFRVDLPGILPPSTFESNAREQAIFNFNYGLSVGRDSRFCLISTNAREVRDHGATLNILFHDKSSVRVEVPAPIALTSTFRPSMQQPETVSDSSDSEPAPDQ